MDVVNAQRVCVEYMKCKDVPIRVKRAMGTVLDNLGVLQRRLILKEKPILVNGVKCCPNCNFALDVEYEEKHCSNCGKAIDWYGWSEYDEIW